MHSAEETSTLKGYLSSYIAPHMAWDKFFSCGLPALQSPWTRELMVSADVLPLVVFQVHKRLHGRQRLM